MSPGLTNGVAVVLALLIHLGVAGVLMATWDEEAPLPPLVLPDRYFIDAAIVPVNPHREAARQAAANEAQRRSAEARRRAEAARVDREKPVAPERAPAPKPDPAPAVPEVAAEPPEPEPPDDGMTDEERARMEQSLALLVVEEQSYLRAITDDEKAMAFAGQIRAEIGRHWSRPPSARNGMEALLRVFLVPTGEVVNVTVESSSGNEAFDRSAVLAVQKAERFAVPQDSRQFERNFREFTVMFRPEDLRL